MIITFGNCACIGLCFCIATITTGLCISTVYPRFYYLLKSVETNHTLHSPEIKNNDQNV